MNVLIDNICFGLLTSDFKPTSIFLSNFIRTLKTYVFSMHSGLVVGRLYLNLKSHGYNLKDVFICLVMVCMIWYNFTNIDVIIMLLRKNNIFLRYGTLNYTKKLLIKSIL